MGRRHFPKFHTKIVSRKRKFKQYERNKAVCTIISSIFYLILTNYVTIRYANCLNKIIDKINDRLTIQEYSRLSLSTCR